MPRISLFDGDTMRNILLSVMVAAVAVTTACGDSSGPGTSAVGTYSLQTVNTKTLPFTFYDDGTQKIEVLSDVYTLSANGTYTNQTVIRTTTGGTSTTDNLSSNGTYKQSGSSITLTDSSDSTDQVTGTLNGSTFTINVSGTVLVYTKS